MVKVYSKLYFTDLSPCYGSTEKPRSLLGKSRTLFASQRNCLPKLGPVVREGAVFRTVTRQLARLPTSCVSATSYTIVGYVVGPESGRNGGVYGVSRKAPGGAVGGRGKRPVKPFAIRVLYDNGKLSGYLIRSMRTDEISQSFNKLIDRLEKPLSESQLKRVIKKMNLIDRTQMSTMGLVEKYLDTFPYRQKASWRDWF